LQETLATTKLLSKKVIVIFLPLKTHFKGEYQLKKRMDGEHQATCLVVGAVMAGDAVQVFSFTDVLTMRAGK